MRKLTGFWRKVVVAMSVALVAFQLYTAGFGVLPDIQQRSVHLFFVLTLIYILKPIKKGGTYLDPEAEAKIAAVANQGK